MIFVLHPIFFLGPINVGTMERSLPNKGNQSIPGGSSTEMQDESRCRHGRKDGHYRVKRRESITSMNMDFINQNQPIDAYPCQLR